MEAKINCTFVLKTKFRKFCWASAQSKAKNKAILTVFSASLGQALTKSKAGICFNWNHHLVIVPLHPVWCETHPCFTLISFLENYPKSKWTVTGDYLSCTEGMHPIKKNPKKASLMSSKYRSCQVSYSTATNKKY